MVTAEISGILKRSGLTENELEMLCKVFRDNPAVTRVVLFGSRAKGTAQPYSDIDLAVEGPEDELEAARIGMQLDELPLPYKFDIQLLTSIRHRPLIEHIERVGMTIYSKADFPS